MSSDLLPTGGRIVYCDLKPCGPYGPALYESLTNPHENTSFSVRSMCKESVDAQTGERVRYIQILLTFDYVDCGGFRAASKRFNAGNEAFEITPDMLRAVNRDMLKAGNESLIISDDEFVTLFGRKCISIHTKATELTNAQYLSQTGVLLDTDGKKRSLIHTALMM